MALEQQIMTELKTAMLAKDEKALRSLRAIKAAILLAKTSEGAGGELKEEDEIKLLQKLVKSRKDSLEIYETQNRPDLAIKEKEEIEVIEKNAQNDVPALTTIAEGFRDQKVNLVVTIGITVSQAGIDELHTLDVYVGDDSFQPLTAG